MAAKDVKIFLKTVADLTGISRVTRRLLKTNALVRIGALGFKKLFTLGKSGFGILASGARIALKPIKLLIGGIAVLTVAMAGLVKEGVTWRIQMARAHTMWQGAGFKEARKQTLALAGALGVAKSQLAGGLYQTLSKGIPKGNALEFLSIAAKAAVADTSDTVTAVDGITTVLNAFHLNISQAQKVADMLFTTVAIGGTTFQELASQIAMVAPLASATGISIEEVNAAIATLTKGGTPTAQAVTQMRAAIIGLNKVLGDGWAKTMSMQDAMVKVGDQAGGSQVKLQALVGTVEGMMGIIGMTGLNALQAAADLREMSNAAGALDTAFSKMDNVRHWHRIWQTALGTLTKFGIEADTVLAPVIDKITEKITAWREGTSIFDTFRVKLQTAVDVLIAGFKTAKTLAVELWATFQSDADKAKTIVVAMFTGVAEIFIFTIIEVLKANINVFIGLAKMVASVFKEEIIAGLQEVPFQATKLQEAAKDRFFDEFTPEQRESFGKAEGLSPDEIWDGLFGGDKKLIAKVLSTGWQEALADAFSLSAGAAPGLGRAVTAKTKEVFGRVGGVAAGEGLSDPRVGFRGHRADIATGRKADEDAWWAAAEQTARLNELAKQLEAVTKEIAKASSIDEAQPLFQRRAQIRAGMSGGKGVSELAAEESQARQDFLKEQARRSFASTLAKEQADVTDIEGRMAGLPSGDRRRDVLGMRLGREQKELTAAQATAGAISGGDTAAIEKQLSLSSGAMREFTHIFQKHATDTVGALEALKQAQAAASQAIAEVKEQVRNIPV